MREENGGGGASSDGLPWEFDSSFIVLTEDDG